MNVIMDRLDMQWIECYLGIWPVGYFLVDPVLQEEGTEFHLNYQGSKEERQHLAIADVVIEDLKEEARLWFTKVIVEYPACSNEPSPEPMSSRLDGSDPWSLQDMRKYKCPSCVCAPIARNSFSSSESMLIEPLSTRMERSATPIILR